MGIPLVASRTLHPAPPKSYTIFMTGCNFRCLYCQNWTIAHYPDSRGKVDGWVEPSVLAEESIDALCSPYGRLMGADRIFFSGGSSTCSLPYVERVVYEARKRESNIKVNFDTNGFMTEDSLERVLRFTTSITFDIRAVNTVVHRMMTGANPDPVLRNAKRVASEKDKLWEFRILVVPEINESELEKICHFLAEIDYALPVCFLAFRPNFVLENHPGATAKLMRDAVQIAYDCGLTNVDWSGHPDLSGVAKKPSTQHKGPNGAMMAAAYTDKLGCVTYPRSCGDCSQIHDCPIKSYQARRRT